MGLELTRDSKYPEPELVGHRYPHADGYSAWSVCSAYKIRALPFPTGPDALARVREEAERRGAERALRELDAEPEMPGEMPDEMWEAIRNDRDAVGEALRIAVRLTKENVRARVFPTPEPTP